MLMAVCIGLSVFNISDMYFLVGNLNMFSHELIAGKQRFKQQSSIDVVHHVVDNMELAL